MIERIDDMPAGTIGLRASGTLTKNDYLRVLEPSIQEGVDSGELRLLFELGAFDGLAEGAWAEDAKTGLKAYLKDRRAWHRFALVTDVEWVAKATKGFAWVIPGESKVFAPEEADAARAWVAG
ncbi:MAG: STAS/SEC14 domain-containing protein [Solirubrobacteraceae bacterium]|nr:STAS/SEC14 domain-containing protein [Solirubrobacteraceae bacterium]